MDLDPIELVLQPVVVAARRQQAQRVARLLVGHFALGGHAAQWPVNQVIPVRELDTAAQRSLRVLDLGDLQLPDRHRTECGIRSTQRLFENRGVFMRGEAALPHVEVSQVVAGGQVDARWRPGLGVCRVG